MNPPPPPPALHAPPSSDGRLTLGEVPFHHRWSKAGQHEFTPVGQEDLKQWTDMLTVVVHEQVRSGEQLAALANHVLERYSSVGRILRTDSVPRLGPREAEHLVVAMLRHEESLEVTFARFALVEGRGMVVVRSRRFSGGLPKAADAATDWLRAQGPTTERTLMAWPIPVPSLFSKLPLAK